MPWVAIFSLGLCAACAPEADVECATAGGAVVASSGALYGASTQPVLIHLSEAQRGALVVVAPLGHLARSACTGVYIGDGLILTARHCNFSGGIRVRLANSNAEFIPTELTAHSTLDLLALRFSAADATELLARAEPIPIMRSQLGAAWLGTSVLLAGAGLAEDNSTGELRFTAESISDLDASSISVDGKGVSGACLGDSGGPLLARGSDGSARVIGILSRGSDSCKGVDDYTRVDAVNSWLGLSEAPPIDSPGCGDLDAAGVCQAHTAMWCRDEKLVVQACSATQSCRWNPDAGGFRCQPADPCTE